jgi:hypothetical protein
MTNATVTLQIPEIIYQRLVNTAHATQRPLRLISSSRRFIMTAITVNLNPIIQLTDNQFYQLCRENPEVKFERNSKGEILIMSPTGGGTGKRNFEIGIDFGICNPRIIR